MVAGMHIFQINLVAPNFFVVVRYTGPLLPPGTNVLSTISLSEVNTGFFGVAADPKFAIIAFIEKWTFYRPDGTESEPQSADLFSNVAIINNCARITYALAGERVAGSAQANIYIL
jgi:hypothetical protein